MYPYLLISPSLTPANLISNNSLTTDVQTAPRNPIPAHPFHNFFILDKKGVLQKIKFFPILAILERIG